MSSATIAVLISTVYPVGILAYGIKYLKLGWQHGYKSVKRVIIFMLPYLIALFVVVFLTACTKKPPQAEINPLERKTIHGERIAPQEFKDYVRRFENAFPDQTKAQYYSREIFDDILSNPDIDGIWICEGLSEGGKMRSILAGGDVKMVDEDEAYQRGLTCPHNCPEGIF